jgi:hypothetical protein
MGLTSFADPSLFSANLSVALVTDPTQVRMNADLHRSDFMKSLLGQTFSEKEGSLHNTMVD